MTDEDNTNIHVASHSYQSLDHEVMMAGNYASSLNRAVVGGLAHPDKTFVLAFAIESLAARYNNSHENPYGRETYKNTAASIQWQLAELLGYRSVLDEDFKKDSKRLAAEVIAWWDILGVELYHRRTISGGGADMYLHHWIHVYKSSIENPKRAAYYLVGIHTAYEIEQFIKADIDAELAAKSIGAEGLYRD